MNAKRDLIPMSSYQILRRDAACNDLNWGIWAQNFDIDQFKFQCTREYTLFISLSTLLQRNMKRKSTNWQYQYLLILIRIYSNEITLKTSEKLCICNILGSLAASSGFSCQTCKSGFTAVETSWKLLRLMVLVFALLNDIFMTLRYVFVIFVLPAVKPWDMDMMFQKKTRITAFLVFWNSFSSQVSIKRVECWNIPETNPPGVQSQVPHASILRNSSFLTGVSVVSYHLCKIHLAKIAAKERRRNRSKFPNPDIYIYIHKHI